MEIPFASFPVKFPDTDTEIAALLRRVTDATKAGNLPLALRMADRAHRLAPGALEITRLYCSLLITNGFAADASAEISSLKAGVRDAEFAAIDVEASLGAAGLEAAAAKLELYLSRFAISRWSGLAKIARRVVTQMGPACAGWIGVTPDYRLIGDLRNSDGSDLPMEVSLPEQSSVLELISCSDGWCDEGALGSIRAEHGLRISSLSWLASPIGAAVSIPKDFGLSCEVTPVSTGLAGRVCLSWLPPEVVPSLFAVSGNARSEIWLEPDPDWPGHHRFEIKASAFKRWRRPVVDLYVRLPDGREQQLYGSPYPLAAAKRHDRIGLKTAKIPEQDRALGVKIIIPVYGGRQVVAECLASVCASVPQNVEIIVIDDASPDDSLRADLDGLANSGAITLLRNAENIGFPASVNRGITVAADHDVIVLNSDTIVFPGWLERMRAHAETYPQYATITPLSNAGSIASYPAVEEPKCPRDRAELRDELAATINAKAIVEAPTGVGFCMFMRRAAIDQVGDFDEYLFSLGYGEENDFCMRTSACGWKHGIACDIYVLHHGGMSFGPRKAALMARNGAILNQRHPSYPRLVEEFASRDPLAPFRRMLSAAEVAHQDKQCLVISLGIGGGVERHVSARLKDLRATGFSPILVRPSSDGKQLRIDSNEIPTAELRYDLDAEKEAFEAFLEGCTLEHLEIHHCLGVPAEIIDTCIRHAPSFDIYIHDFSWYCPRLTLLGLSNRYCGEPEIDRCEQCVGLLGTAMDDSIGVTDLRRRSLRWFVQATRVIVPTADTASRYQRQFPEVRFDVTPWETALAPIKVQAPLDDAPLKIAVIGAIGEQKGYDFLLECARYAALRDLPVEFVVLGFTQDDPKLTQTGKIFITGRYEESEIPYLLQREAPAAAVFLSVTPETWCFSLSHALRANLPVLAFNQGAIAERLRASDVEYELVDLGITAQSLYRALVDLVERHRTNLASRHTPILHSGLAREPAAASLFRSELPPGVQRVSVSENISATAEFLKLAKGVYLFSVASDDEEQRDDTDALPAIQISTAPGIKGGAVEYLGSRNTGQHWLYRSGDNLVLKVNQSPADIVVTLITRPNLKPLQIDVQKLEGEGERLTRRQIGSLERARTSATQFANPDMALPAVPETAECLKSQIVAHVQNVGDMVFFDQSWVGASDRLLSIEAFTITPMLNVAPAGIEYKCLMATGIESHWTEQGQPCGTRGLSTPLLGFAVRSKNEGHDGAFTCQYSGRFSSGKLMGPLKDGEMCSGIGPSDYLVSMWVRIIDHRKQREQVTDTSHSSQKTNRKSVRAQQPLGPRFSVFREIDA